LREQPISRASQLELRWSAFSCARFLDKTWEKGEFGAKIIVIFRWREEIRSQTKGIRHVVPLTSSII